MVDEKFISDMKQEAIKKLNEGCGDLLQLIMYLREYEDVKELREIKNNIYLQIKNLSTWTR